MYYCNTCKENHKTEELCPKLGSRGCCPHGFLMAYKNCLTCFPDVIKENIGPLLKDTRQQAHYTQHKIQPVVYIGMNKIDFLAGNVIKYVSRYNLKNGLEDLQKARHYLDMLIQRELGEEIVP